MKEEVKEQIPLPQKDEVTTPEIKTSLKDRKKVSGLSLKSIQKKKEILAKQQAHKPVEEEQNEAFTEIQMLAAWNQYVQRLKDKGEKILASTLETGEPKLEDKTILLELPNETMRLQLEKDRNPLLGFLKRKLKNTHISIRVTVNEQMEKQYAFTPIEKYNKLKEKNPLIEKLRTTFDLDI